MYVFSAAVESTGAAKAEAQSRAEAARIQGEAAVEEAKLKVEAQRIEAVCLSFSSYLSVHAFPYYVSYTHTQSFHHPSRIQSTVLMSSISYWLINIFDSFSIALSFSPL